MLLVKFVKYISLLLALCVAVGLISSQDTTNFRFNVFALLPAFTVVVNLVLLIIINRPRMRNPVTLCVSFYIALLTIWGISEFLVRLSADTTTVTFWSDWGTVGWTFMPAAFLIFTRVYVGSEEELGRPSLWAAILMVPIIFLVVSQTSTLCLYMTLVSGSLGWLMISWTPRDWNRGK